MLYVVTACHTHEGRKTLSHSILSGKYSGLVDAFHLRPQSYPHCRGVLVTPEDPKAAKIVSFRSLPIQMQQRWAGTPISPPPRIITRIQSPYISFLISSTMSPLRASAPGSFRHAEWKQLRKHSHS